MDWKMGRERGELVRLVEGSEDYKNIKKRTRRERRTSGKPTHFVTG
jgi:hypothetical protein